MKKYILFLYLVIFLNCCLKGKSDAVGEDNKVQGNITNSQNSGNGNSNGDSKLEPQINKSLLTNGNWSMEALLQPYSSLVLQFRSNSEHAGFICDLDIKPEYNRMNNEAVLDTYENIEIDFTKSGMKISSLVTEYKTKRDLTSKVNGVTTNVTFFVDRDMLVAAILSKEGGDADIPSVFHVFVDKEGDRYISRKVMRYGDYP